MRKVTQQELDERNTERQKEQVRAKRNRLLNNTDWMINRSVEQNSAMPKDWKDYRKALRDITKQSGFPHDVVWPEEPDQE